MQLIGICGLAGSGKDTIASHLIDNFNFVKLSFADTLKDVLSSTFGWDRIVLEGTTPENRDARNKLDDFWSKKLNKPVTMRSAMTDVGTELFRKHFNEDIWVYSCERKLTGKDKVVITDVRFPNEIEMIRRNNGIIIEVQRNQPTWVTCITKKTKYQYMQKYYPEIHESEYAWMFENNPEYIFYNNDTISKLIETVNSVLKLN